MNPTPRRPITLVIVALVLMAAACGTDDGASVTVLGGSEASGSSSSASGSSASAASGSSASTASGTATCEPVNADLESTATEQVEVEATDYAFTPDALELPAGVTTFTLDNDGEEDHELAFLPGGGDVPLTADGAPDEDALEAAGAFELEAIAPGESCNATYDLEPGAYTLFCIVETEDGRTHYDLGMRGLLEIA